MTGTKSFFGHPSGLSTLFFTEMWERFSYYGMRALLLLFMVTSVEKGGMGFDDKTGSAIYGLYTMFVYLLALPGGWLADNYFGLRKSIFYGGCIITMGHVLMALPFTETFFLGLAFIAIGTGLLKPNISSMVGTLYQPHEGAKRDAGFSIFFMGINLGAFISPFITGYLGQNVNWHYGFAAAGVGMLIGVIQFKLTEKDLGEAGAEPDGSKDNAQSSTRMQTIKKSLWVFAVLFVAFVILLITNVIVINPITIARSFAYIIGGSTVMFFLYLFTIEKLEVHEKKKVLVIAIFFMASATFYAGYEQQGSSLNLFADRYTNMFKIPSSWFQSAPPVFVIIFAPIFAMLWVWFSGKRFNPSTPVKLSLGLIFMGLGYALMMAASYHVISGLKVLPTWLLATYLLHTFGEICLYPVGLSAVTKLAPKRLVGQMMGVWFMSLALGNLLAGLFAGEFDAKAIAANPTLLPDLFWFVAKAMLIAGLIILVLTKPIQKLINGDLNN